VKKLKLNRNLTEYEEKYVETWVMDYKYSFEIIELALKKTTSKTNPNFNYIHSIITDWYKNGFKTKEEILMYDAKRKKTSSKKASMSIAVHQNSNSEQRPYDKAYLVNLYENAQNSEGIMSKNPYNPNKSEYENRQKKASHSLLK